MAQLAFGPLRGWAAQVGRAEQKIAPEQLSAMLPQGISAILLPHFKAALAAYAMKDQLSILTAYAMGCAVLADLLSQNKAIQGWESAGFDALKSLILRSEIEAFQERRVADWAATRAADLLDEIDASSSFKMICQMLDTAINDMSERKTAPQGSVTMRAAMARLEALVFTNKLRADIAA